MKTQPNSHSTDCANPDAIAEQAMAWFARLRADNVTAAQQVQFKSWLEANPAHREAYQNVEAFWRHPDFAEMLSAAKLSAPLLGKGKPARSRWRTPVVLAMVACLLLMITIYRPSINCWQADYCTGIGEIRIVQLADGSKVTLNSNTALNVKLQSDQRHITLTHGEAFFDVRRNPAQPFVVASQYATTRVLGTRFLVRQDQQADTVTVLSGVVEVSGSGRQSAQLRANDQVVVAPNRSNPILQVSATAAVAWIKGHALFDNVPLQDVITELSRYRRGSVLITNARLNTLRVSGRFNITNTDKALQSLQQTLPIRITRVTPWLAVIF